jgi:serine/threonine protein kinase
VDDSKASERAITCPSCNRTLPEGSRFCGFDGTSVAPGSLAAVAARVSSGNNNDTKLCPKCSRRYPEYANHCSFDAEKLIAAPDFPSGSSTDLEPVQGAKSGHVPGPGASPLKQGEQSPVSPVGVAINGEAYSSLIGKVIDGKYKIDSIIGEGGMAVVYRANHMQMERPVVIKVMQGWLLSNKNSIERFERECKLTAKLNHPNIVIVYDVGEINDVQPYLVMEYIKGEPLAEKITRQGAMPIKTVGNIVVQICRGLQEAHSVGIIHRDLKPENILLQEKSDRPDWVKIVDFGISHLAEGSKRLTRTGKMIGTPEYIAPEQLRDRAIDVRTDIYSLGIMMYELLTGRTPFDGETAEAILMKHLLDEPPPISQYRDEFDDKSTYSQIVMKALKKNPEDRYQTVTELRLDLEGALSAEMLKRG